MGIYQDIVPLYLGFSVFVHNVRKCEKAALSDDIPYSNNLIKDNDFGEIAKVDYVFDFSSKIETIIIYYNNCKYSPSPFGKEGGLNTYQQFNSSDFNLHFKDVINDY